MTPPAGDPASVVPERGFLSIGEVLDLLKGEYPDVTISKIRFLESQGLIDPERTPSGYRKFHAPDVERLRWILHQQRENFLPLKVIKEKLADAGPGPLPVGPTVVPAPPAAPEPVGATAADAPGPEATPRPALEPTPEPDDVEGPHAKAGAAPAGDGAAPRVPAPVRRPADEVRGGGPLVEDLTAASLNRDELLSASGLSNAQLDQLERYGMLAGRPMGGQVYYDGDCLVVATLAAAFARHGVEARHLRMYKTSAEREAGFYEQVVAPLVKQRNPRSRAQARETLAELAGLGESLRGALLRQALRGYTTGG